jgi:hypothetical protein
LAAVKVAGDAINPVRFKDDATTDELRAEMMRRISRLQILCLQGFLVTLITWRG